MKAMIFAAGIGSRLRPFTLEHPKALVDVCGKPALAYVIEAIVSFGIKDIVVNVHHFADQIEEYFQAHPITGVKFTISDERDCLLETGGALLKAKDLLQSGEDILIYNTDIISNVSLEKMYNQHCTSHADATLLVSQRESSRYLLFDDKMQLRGWRNMKTGETIPSPLPIDNTYQPLAFGGIHIISSHILDLLSEYYQQVIATKSADKKEISPFGIIPFYLHIAHAESKVEGYIQQNPYMWHDIGNNETLEIARNEISKKQI